MSKKIYALLLFINCANIGFTQSTTNPAERKVDYLEKIYFSGKNKEGLNTLILATIQQLEALPSTTAAVARQYAFLKGIKPQANEAENACDIAELIAAGLYDIDVTEAQAQNVHAPGDKAKAGAGDALQSLSNINNSLGNTSNELTGLAWTNYVTTGKTTGFGTASKVAGVAGTMGTGVALASGGASIVNGTKSTLKSLGFGPKDKPCKSIIAKEIQIGEHLVSTPVTNTVNSNAAPPTGTITTSQGVTVIIISGVDYAKLSTIDERLKNCATISEAKMKFDTSGSLINVSHSGSVEDLLAIILTACKDMLSNKNVIGMNPEERKISLKM